MTTRDNILQLHNKGLSITRIAKELGVTHQRVKEILRKPVTPTFKEAIVQLRLEHKSYQEIQNIVGCARSTVSYCCRKYVSNNREIAKQLNKERRPKQRYYPRIASDNDIRLLLPTCLTLSELALKLGYKPNNKGFLPLAKRINKLGLDTSHLIGKVHQHLSSLDQPKTRRRFILNLRGHQCEQCKLCVWLDKPIGLDVHHLNHDRSDNRLDNLILLCPNCHRYQHIL